MPWSLIHFIHEPGGSTVVADGHYSSLAVRQLEAVGFTLDPATGLHHLTGLTGQDRYNRVQAAEFLLEANGITHYDRRSMGVEELLACLPQAQSERDLATLTGYYVDHDDNPARCFERFATLLKNRLSQITPPGTTHQVLDDLDDLVERCVDLAGHLTGIAEQLKHPDPQATQHSSQADPQTATALPPTAPPPSPPGPLTR